MGILEKGSWAVVALGPRVFSAACSSETDASGGAGGLQWRYIDIAPDGTIISFGAL